MFEREGTKNVFENEKRKRKRKFGLKRGKHSELEKVMFIKIKRERRNGLTGLKHIIQVSHPPRLLPSLSSFDTIRNDSGPPLVVCECLISTILNNGDT